MFEVINKRFLAVSRKMYNLVNDQDRFFDFDLGHVTEAGEVENCRFLENCSMDFDKNQATWSLFETLSAENIKSAKIKISKNRFL